jgi:putative molybdopterin biosynthesis protein
MLILTGSLDPSLEELAGIAHDDGLFIHATNPGNTAGLLALRSHTCHAAPLSLPARSMLSQYQPFIKFLEVGNLAFIHIATVELGIASSEGLGIRDLTSARFINTRRESPARVVLDSLLAAEGIDPSSINGYLQEVHGAPAVAAAIRNGFADAGMCTSSIAGAAGLQFVPVASEDYELTVCREMLEDSRIRTLVALIQSPAYRAILARLGGYDTSLTGMIRGLNGENTLIPFSPGSLPAGYL